MGCLCVAKASHDSSEGMSSGHRCWSYKNGAHDLPRAGRGALLTLRSWDVRFPCPAHLLGGEGPGLRRWCPGIFWMELSLLPNTHKAKTAGQSTAASCLMSKGMLLEYSDLVM